MVRLRIFPRSRFAKRLRQRAGATNGACCHPWPPARLHRRPADPGPGSAPSTALGRCSGGPFWLARLCLPKPFQQRGQLANDRFHLIESLPYGIASRRRVPVWKFQDADRRGIATLDRIGDLSGGHPAIPQRLGLLNRDDGITNADNAAFVRLGHNEQLGAGEL